MDKHTQHGVAEMARKLDHLTMNAMWEENQRLKVVNADLLKALEDAYILALQMPDDLLRINNQPTLAAMRDAISGATGRSSEDVQNDFEARAYAKATG